MDQKAARAAAAKAFKQRKVALRKGHWRLGGGEVSWYVDLRADGLGPGAPLHFEVGAWIAELDQPEPEGGAVDCPLLHDVDLDTSGGSSQVAAAVDALVDRLRGTDRLAGLAAAWQAGEYAGALIDPRLRALLEE